MGFTKTSEGRVYFKNPDNDDLPLQDEDIDREPRPKSDNAQMQILLLLKTLNTKLKDTKTDQAALKSELVEYKRTIKSLEEKANAHESNYIDLEQKVALKQKETNKRSSRVEDGVKKTLKQLEEAKKLVQELEEKDNSRDASLEALRAKISEQRKREQKLVEKQKSLETQQKSQGEKMVNNVAAYVALTKRVSETEAQNEALDNKIEDVSSEYMKLDRKIDKAIEDRNRILRKVDRIEQAVLETRDALNAKAMVLLTDQGVAGVDMPQLSDESLQTDPTVLNRRLHEEALMPWWRRPVRLHATSLIIMTIVVLLLGWIMNEFSTNNAPTYLEGSPVSKTVPVTKLDSYNESSLSSDSYGGLDTNVYNLNANTDLANEDFDSSGSLNSPEPLEDMNSSSSFDTDSVDHGIRIHKGYSDPAEITESRTGEEPLDVYDDNQLASAFAKDPDRVARALNDIEPAKLTTEDMENPPAAVEPPEPLAPVIDTPPPAPKVNKDQYVADLKRRIQPDPKLTAVAKKIETQALEGVPEAQHDMGAIYVSGYEDVPQDLDRAVLWFKEAAKNNVANAKYNLGVLYHQGIGVEQSLDNAITLYKEAAQLKHPEAQYNLGIANIEGIGVPYNPERAAYFFEQSANEGVTEAAYNLGLIYENGLLGSTRPDDALAWYKTAADQGSPEAQSALDQLAASLGIGINDVNRIVEKIQKNKRAQTGASSNSSNSLTSEIQQELMNRGLYPGPVDGMLGPMTKNAIREFQRSASLDANGEPSQELLSYLRSSYTY